MAKIEIIENLNKEISSNANEGIVNVANLVKRLQDFLKEFNINLSIRLFNTLVNIDTPAEHLLNYALLTGRDYIDLSDKTNSKEWKIMESEIKSIKTDKKINTRFDLYFGSAGTGKTTQAIKEAGQVVVMNENITPKELVFDFTFENGQPKFVKNAFARAMEEGKPIVLDEINLAPFETIRFLQGVLDNKEEVIVSDTLIKIKDGFKVIGTMNEEVLGMESFLPEPLVDRACVLKKFVLTPERLAELAV